MVIKTIVHFEIPAGDVEKLQNFYSQCFNWKFEKVPMSGFDYWLISTGPRGKSVGGGMYKKMGSSDAQRNYIQVEEIDAAIQTFKAAGGTEIVGKQEVPETGWTFIGADPEGNPIGLFQPQARSRSRRTSTTTRRRRSKSSRR